MARALAQDTGKAARGRSLDVVNRHALLPQQRPRLRLDGFARIQAVLQRVFLLPRGALDPSAPPCIRQRFFPIAAGDLQGLPDRVLAPQRRLDSLGPL